MNRNTAIALFLLISSPLPACDDFGANETAFTADGQEQIAGDKAAEALSKQFTAAANLLDDNWSVTRYTEHAGVEGHTTPITLVRGKDALIRNAPMPGKNVTAVVTRKKGEITVAWADTINYSWTFRTTPDGMVAELTFATDFGQWSKFRYTYTPAAKIPALAELPGK